MADGINIEIEGTLMRVGHEMYNLNNIARVSKYVRTNGGLLRALMSRKWRLLLLFVLIGVAQAGAPPALSVVLFLVLIGTLAYIVWTVYGTPKLYILLIESGGVVNGVLGSHNPAVIDEMVELIAKSINHPPATAIFRSYGDVITNIDQRQFNQNAPGSIGQQYNNRRSSY